MPCDLLNGKTVVFPVGLQEEMNTVPFTIPKFTLERKTNQASLEENAAFFLVWPFQISVLSLPKLSSLELASVAASLITTDLNCINLYEKL